MRVEARLSPAAPGPRGRAAAPGARFSLGAPARAGTAPGSAAGVAAGGAVHALVALQGEEEPARRRRRAVARGRDMLAGLDALKAALLAGRLPPGVLASLRAQLAARSEGSGDPVLDELVAMVELRAAVEVAKLNRAARP